MRVFSDRHDAGVQLARALHRYTEASDALVIAHTLGSVPVAYEVATRLALPLELYADDVGDVDPELAYDDTRHAIDVADRLVLLIDDGDAARELPAAIERLRERGARTIVAAVAVASPQVHLALAAAADELICMLAPQHIYSVQAWYADFTAPSDEDIRQLRVAAARNLLGLRHRRFSQLNR